MGNIAVPTSVNGHSVTSIGNRAFYDCRGLTSVTIPSSVTSIGYDAFYGCNSLRRIVISGDCDIDAVKRLLDESGFSGEVLGSAWTYAVAFNANGGTGTMELQEFVHDEEQALTSNAFVRAGYAFSGWAVREDAGGAVYGDGAIVSNMTTVAGGVVTLYAQWDEITEPPPVEPPVEQPEEPIDPPEDHDPPVEPPEDPEPPEEPVEPTTPTNALPTVVDEAETHVDVEKGEVAPFADAAAVYDGFLYENGKVVGSVQVKVAKMKNGEAKVTATVQMAGQAKKLSFKNGIADATGTVTEMTDKDGNKLAVTVGVKGLGGGFIEAALPAVTYRIDGARNVFSGKSAADKDAASEAVKRYQDTYNVAFDGGTLSVSVDKKGKAKIAGTVGGNKVSATSQLVVGKDAAVVPVVITKKVNVAFCLWVMANGTVEARGIEGAIADRPSTLKAGAKFGVDGAAGVRALPGLYGEYLPNGIVVSASGTKWIVAGGAKAGKVAFVKGGNTIDESKLGTNPSGLKLSYKQKDGTFKGSFKVYNLESNGKIKAYTASVTGVMIDTKGYGTATIKKPFTVIPITIE